MTGGAERNEIFFRVVSQATVARREGQRIESATWVHPSQHRAAGDISELLTRPVGRPGQKPVVWYKGFLYQAASWKMARRVVAKVEHHVGELFPRVGFFVTYLTLPSWAVLRFYRKRATAEQRIKEGK